MDTTTAVAALAALAQDTRLAVFRLLVEAGPEGMTVGRIGESLSVAPATLAFHLKELRNAELIFSRPESRFIWYSANYEAMNELIAYLTDNCCQGRPEACGAVRATKKSAKRRKKVPA